MTLTLSLAFNRRAAGHSYDVEVLATDDKGRVQGFARAGSLTVLR